MQNIWIMILVIAAAMSGAASTALLQKPCAVNNATRHKTHDRGFLPNTKTTRPILGDGNAY